MECRLACNCSARPSARERYYRRPTLTSNRQTGISEARNSPRCSRNHWCGGIANAYLREFSTVQVATLQEFLMKVIIPLAGFGTRLRPHTYTKPKPLINVAGKPVLGHLLDKIAGLDIEEYIFVVGYLGEQVEEYVNTNYTLNARFVEQKELLGQAHAIWLAREYLDDGPVFILFVDTLFEADLSNLERPDADAVIFVKEVEDPRSFGVVTLDKDNYITSFVEKPRTMDNRLAVVGLYYFKNGNKLINAIKELMERKIMTKN